MIRFHGGPITPLDVAYTVWNARHACVSFYYPGQVSLAFEVAQSVMLDNGAFSAWTAGKPVTDWTDYAEWVKEWRTHPGFAFAVIPDVIDGTEADNANLIAWWRERVGFDGCVPVWHLHESMARLRYLAHAWPRIALGSSGQYAQPASDPWWERMTEAMAELCDAEGRPRTKLHGLRMMNATIFSRIPLASCDSTNVAQNHASDDRWRGPYMPVSKAMRALVLAERMERHVSAARWNAQHGAHHFNLELVG